MPWRVAARVAFVHRLVDFSRGLTAPSGRATPMTLLLGFEVCDHFFVQKTITAIYGIFCALSLNGKFLRVKVLVTGSFGHMYDNGGFGLTAPRSTFVWEVLRPKQVW